MEWTIYVDLDAFYVACELRDRPELVGRPVLVGPDPSKGPTRGVVLSASYAARPFGARSAMPVARAAALVPDAVWIAPDHAKYARISGEVLARLRTLADRVVPLSIDEAAIPWESEELAPVIRKAEEIQGLLERELGLSASIGIAAHRTVAKIASDRNKPHGLTVVPPEEVRAFLAPLPPRAIPGIGPKTAARLEAAGFLTIDDLARAGRVGLRPVLGGFAEEIAALARGQPRPLPPDSDGAQLRSTDRTFAEDLRDAGPLEAAVAEMATALFAAVQEEGLRASAVGIALRWEDFTRTQRRHSLPHAVTGPEELRAEAVRLLRTLLRDERAHADRGVRTLSLRLERLRRSAGRQDRLDGATPGAGPPLN